ncbi:MAG: carboxylating nicotinate-nucleotide diphosphorylase [Oscillospiraceae bacterium]|jgi:nicotinate-nucleotide pyrophosphorylase (carboxylating)|nr:carboxylating nicotinate-nucleotide diphosphorylase [Oscillospiraceae bacterium]
MVLSQQYIDDIICTALTEDINYTDITTDNLFFATHLSNAYLIAKDRGVLCGIAMALRVFDIVGSVRIKKLFKDSDNLKKGDIIATMEGETKSLLKGERTVLNILQHLSGIATYTNKCVKAVEGTNAVITDTRKTLPGLRALQKYAVTVGGGRNHRFNLSDCAMLKDNHIAAYNGITGAVKELRKRLPHTAKIEVEVTDFEQLREAIDNNVEIIMLDNMSLEDMTNAGEITAKRALLEASGNVTLDNIRQVAQTGIDIISLGALTHSVKAFDISMRFEK